MNNARTQSKQGQLQTHVSETWSTDYEEWAEQFTADAIEDKYAAFEEELVDLGLSIKPKAMLQPTLLLVQACLAEDFVPSMVAIEQAAMAHNVFVYVTSSFRPAGYLPDGTIVPPATFSDHLVGHAIDMNVQYFNEHGVLTTCNSAGLGQTQLPAPVAGFIQAIRDAGLRWGGDFSTPDVVHIDDDLYHRDSQLWQQGYDSVQACATTAGLVVQVHSPVNLLLTDPIGRRIGISTVNGVINELGADGVVTIDSHPVTYIIRHPLQGVYTLNATGTGAGPFTTAMFTSMDVSKSPESLEPLSQPTEISGVANVGSVYQTVIEFNPEGRDLLGDITAPEIVGRLEDFKVPCDPGICGAKVSWTEPTARDNVGVSSFTSDHKPGDYFAVGNTKVTYTASDGAGNMATFAFSVTVEDREKPAISGVVTAPNILWPANHKMALVSVDYTATDNCAVNTTSLSATSNEPDNGLGDGDQAGDIQLIPGDANRLYLRAERSGTGPGRVYTISVTCTDIHGNTATKQVPVVVPHDQVKK